MIIRTITLRDFRNIEEADLELAGSRQFFQGANGQGKSNLLEAASLLPALRSFRAPDTRNVVMRGREEAGAAFVLQREGFAAERVSLRIRQAGKELWHGENRVGRLADHVGRFPAVVFSSQDLQLVRGAPALRRRWMDLTLASMDAAYLSALQVYSRALAGRNILLKRRDGAPAGELAAFDRVLAPAGASIVAMRAERIAEIARLASDSYGRIADGSEAMSLRYDTQLLGTGPEALLGQLEAGRARDARLGSTLTGPHRDDLRFDVGGSDAREFASEGQQRSAMLALRLAQASWSKARSGIGPVLLADDVLGELDPGRRARFWAALDPASQVIATGTQPPDASLASWQVFTVAAGRFSPEARPMGDSG